MVSGAALTKATSTCRRNPSSARPRYRSIECQVCGAGGTLEKTEDGKWKFVIQKDGLLKDRTTVAGRAKHLEEIAQTQGGFFSDPAKTKPVQERKAAYAQKTFKGID